MQNTQHRYRVIRLWEEDPEQFLNDPALLPFATLAATNNPENLLGQIGICLITPGSPIF